MQSVRRPEIVCERVSTSIELDFDIPAPEAWSIIGDFSADWLANKIPMSEFNSIPSTLFSPADAAAAASGEMLAPLFQVVCSRDGFTRSIKSAFKQSSLLQTAAYSDRLVARDDLAMTYTYTRREHRPAQPSLVRSLDNADPVCGLAAPVSRPPAPQDDLALAQPAPAATDVAGNAVPEPVRRMLAELAAEDAEQQRLRLHRLHGTAPADDDILSHARDVVGSFAVVPTGFRSSRLVWRCAATPVVAAGYVSQLLQREAAAHAELSLALDDDDAPAPAPALSEAALASLREDATLAVWARLHAQLALHAVYLRHAVARAGPGGRSFPEPLPTHIEADRRAGSPEVFLEKLVAAWRPARRPQHSLHAALDTPTGRFAEGPALRAVAAQVAPVLLDGLAHVAQEQQRAQRRAEVFEEQRVTRPLLAPPKPFRPLHCLAAYLVANNTRHAGAPSEAAKAIMKVLDTEEHE
jgi:hypothetical protein